MPHLPQEPHEATKALFAALSSRRMRDVLGKRFGLKGGKKKTLEAIGKEYKITRERVRQIESDALKQLRKPDVSSVVAPTIRAIEEHIMYHGNVMAEHHLMETVSSDARQHPHIALLLGVGNTLKRVPETESEHQCWATDSESIVRMKKVLDGVVGELEKKKQPVSKEELYNIMKQQAADLLGEQNGDHVVETYLAASKMIRQNPYGEYGCAGWPTITPRGVKDKAYVVLAKSGKPMHFQDVTRSINTIGWSKRRAHPQTVHNELIKDPRFVLVGRGLYALAEWGYEPGVVRDVLASILKHAGKPLSKDEIIERVKEKRLVKPTTILLNLQNKKFFRRTDDGKYALV